MQGECLFIIAVALLISGHICKVYRWKSFVEVYEDVDEANLMKALAVGQGINMLIPYRIGDIVRMYFAGRKMKNGFALSIATVIADLYIDTLTVGVAFGVLYVLQIHPDVIAVTACKYVLLSLTLLSITVLAVLFKKQVKKVIKIVASIFNDKVELGILYTSYSFFESIKNIFRQINAIRFCGFTVGIWTAYFAAYEAFAQFLQKRSANFTLTSVFSTIFSFNQKSLLLVGVSRKDLWNWIIPFFFLLGIPLAILLMISCVKGRRTKGEAVKYRYVLPQLNQNEKLSFLEMYFKDEEKREYISLYLHLNQDVNVIRDYSAGSNATTMLCLNERGTFFRKYAFGEDAIKLKEQIEWLEKYPDILPLPNILDKKYGDNYCSYDMEYNSKAIGFFQYIHSAPTEKSWKVLKEVLELLRKNLYSLECREAEKVVIDKYIDSKILNNIENCKNGGKYLKALWDYNEIVINGRKYPNLKNYLHMFDKEKLEDLFIGDIYSIIHGDLTIENIVCIQGKTEDDWYLIDPNTGSMHESPFLDYSKLLQSLHGGYEFLMMVKDVEIKENTINFLFTKSMAYNDLYEKLVQYFYENFTQKEIKSIFFHEIVHYLRLMPYKIRKDPKRAVVFYAGMLMIIFDIKNMFGDSPAV